MKKKLISNLNSAYRAGESSLRSLVRASRLACLLLLAVWSRQRLGPARPAADTNKQARGEAVRACRRRSRRRNGGHAGQVAVPACVRDCWPAIKAGHVTAHQWRRAPAGPSRIKAERASAGRDGDGRDGDPWPMDGWMDE
jgi:hypothetical protein